MNNRSLLAMILLAVSATARGDATAPASAPTFTLAEAAGSTAVDDALGVADGRVVVTIVKSGMGPLMLDLAVGGFTGERGDVVPALIELPKLSPAAVQSKVTVDGPILEVPLRVDLRDNGKYHGVLMAVPSGGGQAQRWKLSLTRAMSPRPATLVIDQKQIDLTVMRPAGCVPLLACESQDGASFSLRLWDNDLHWPLTGVGVRLDGAAKGPGAGFDLANDIVFGFDRLPNRSVGAGEQAELTGKVTRLEAGEYSAALRVTAANSRDSDQQKLQLSLHVRDHWLWPLLTLGIGLVLSMLGTGWVAGRRLRLAIQQRVIDLRASGIGQDAPLLPVVWARATLKQAKTFAEDRNWAVGGDEIGARLTQAQRVIDVLDAARATRRDLDALRTNSRRWSRATGALGRLLDRLDPQHLTDAQASDLVAQILALRAWIDAKTAAAVYWEDLNADIDGALGDVPGDLGGQEQAVLEALSADLVARKQKLQANAPALSDVERCDDTFQALRLLSRWHGCSEQVALLQINSRNLDELYRQSDEALCARMQAPGFQLSVERERAAESVEEYDMIPFSVTTNDPVVSRSYLFKHGLRYSWSVALPGGATLTPETHEPKIVQFAPRSGQMTIQVSLELNPDVTRARFTGNQRPSSPAKTVTIEDSQQFALRSGLLQVERVSLAVTFVIAVASGLSLYYKNPIFGSMEDYLLLFLWAAGLDQAKKLVGKS